MAHSIHYEKFKFTKTEVFGIGSYGAVCKARCNDLPCTAKVLHSTLFQWSRGNDCIAKKIEQECYFLDTIRDPHIVQYLGTCHNPESRLPVLL